MERTSKQVIRRDGKPKRRGGKPPKEGCSQLSSRSGTLSNVVTEGNASDLMGQYKELSKVSSASLFIYKFRSSHSPPPPTHVALCMCSAQRPVATVEGWAFRVGLGDGLVAGWEGWCPYWHHAAASRCALLYSGPSRGLFPRWRCLEGRLDAPLGV